MARVTASAAGWPTPTGGKDGSYCKVSEARFSAPDANGWATVELQWQTEEPYTLFSFQIGKPDPYASCKYNYDIRAPYGEAWVVPGDPELYGSYADALTSLERKATVIIHYQKGGEMDGWKIGTWFTSEIDGDWGKAETPFTMQDDWGYIAIVRYEDVLLKQLGFMAHQSVMYDGYPIEWYESDEVAAGNIDLKCSFAEVWVTANSGISLTPPADAPKFEENKAWPISVPAYKIMRSPAGARVVFHYYRADQNYDGWQIGAWGEMASGDYCQGNVEFTSVDEDGAAVAEFSLKGWPIDTLEFMPHYNNWESTEGDTHYFDVSGLASGDEVHVYLYEGLTIVFDQPQPKLVRFFHSKGSAPAFAASPASPTAPADGSAPAAAVGPVPALAAPAQALPRKFPAAVVVLIVALVGGAAIAIPLFLRKTRRKQ